MTVKCLVKENLNHTIKVINANSNVEAKKEALKLYGKKLSIIWCVETGKEL